MRILFFGDLAPTGFGTVTMDMGRAMIERGIDVRFVSQNLVDDLPEPFASRTLQLGQQDVDPVLSEEDADSPGLGIGFLSMWEHGIRGLMDGRGWKDGWVPDTALILGDFGSVRLLVLRSDETRGAFATIPTFHYVPIEGVDLPPRLAEMWGVVNPIAMTDFGAQQIERVTGTRPPFVYHGVDTDLFRPLTPKKPLRFPDATLRTKEDAKKRLGMPPGSKLLLRTDRNMPRKRYPELIRSLAPLIAERGDTYLLMHCRAMDQGGDLYDTLSKYKASVRSRMIVTDGTVSREELVMLYNAADVYVSNSAEGFGLTIAEALACGTPAVGMAYSAVPEVIGPGGKLAPVASLVDNEYGYFWAGVDQKAFAAEVAYLLEDPALAKRTGEAGREHVVRSFDWGFAAEAMANIIAERAGLEVSA